MHSGDSARRLKVLVSWLPVSKGQFCLESAKMEEGSFWSSFRNARVKSGASIKSVGKVP